MKLKKSLIISAVFVYAALFASSASAFTKVNDYLYVDKRADDLYLVMERIDEAVPNNRLAFWQQFIASERSAYIKYLQNSNGYLKSKQTQEKLNEGHGAFHSSVDGSYPKYSEVWVAFATPKPVRSAEDLGALQVEMFVSFMTTEGSPVAGMIGINRSFEYLNESAYEEGRLKDLPLYPIHKNLATTLQAYAASVLVSRDKATRYIITDPAPTMLGILKKALPKNVYVDDVLSRAKDLYKSEQRKNGDCERVRELKKELEAARKELMECEADRDLARLKVIAICDKLTLEENLQVKNGADKLVEQSGGLTVPILLTTLPARLRLYEKNCKTVIFDYDYDLKRVEVGNKVLEGDATKKYGFVFHSHIGLINPVAIDIDALVKLY